MAAAGVATASSPEAAAATGCGVGGRILGGGGFRTMSG
jgi:hypothetical protein